MPLFFIWVSVLDRNRLVARYRHAIAGARLGVIIPDRLMHGATVIPKGDGVRPPTEATLIPFLFAVIEQIIQDGAALARRKFVDLGNILGIQVQTFAPRDGMNPHHRMVGDRKDAVWLLGDGAIDD